MFGLCFAWKDYGCKGINRSFLKMSWMCLSNRFLSAWQDGSVQEFVGIATLKWQNIFDILMHSSRGTDTDVRLTQMSSQWVRTCWGSNLHFLGLGGGGGDNTKPKQRETLWLFFGVLSSVSFSFSQRLSCVLMIHKFLHGFLRWWGPNLQLLVPPTVEQWIGWQPIGLLSKTHLLERVYTNAWGCGKPGNRCSSWCVKIVRTNVARDSCPLTRLETAPCKRICQRIV